MPDPKADGRGRAVGWHHHQLPVKAFQADGRASNAETDPMLLAKGSHSCVLLMLGPHRVHVRKYKNNQGTHRGIVGMDLSSHDGREDRVKFEPDTICLAGQPGAKGMDFSRLSICL